MFEQAVAQLTHANPTVRYEAAQTLGTLNDRRAIEPLIGAVTDANAKVQYAAVSALIKLGDAQASAPIITMLLDTPTSRVWDLLALNIGMRLRSGLLNMIQRGDSHLAGRLIDALEGGAMTEQQRAFSVRALGRTADNRLLDKLMQTLLQGTLVMQAAAAEALGWIGDHRAVPVLMVFANDSSAELREVVLEALGRLGDPQAYDVLAAALKDRDQWIRRAAAVGLGELGDRRAIEPLADALRDCELVQEAAFEALKKYRVSSWTD